MATLQQTLNSQKPLEKKTEFLLQRERRPNSPAATREETRLPHLNSRGVLTPLLPLERNPEIPITTREESPVSRHKSKQH